MKKTVLSILIVAVLVAAMLTATACSTDSGMFRINEERAGKQVTAVAEYNGRLGIVDVNDVYASFQNYYNYLYMYYQYGYIDAATFQSYLSNLDETLGNSNKSLARTALYNLKCLDYLYNYYSANADAAKVAAMREASTVGRKYNWSNMDSLASYFVDRNLEIEAVLACHSDFSYVNAAIRDTNESIQKLYDDYLDAVKSEANVTIITGDTTPAGYTDIRIVEEPIRKIYEATTSDKVNLDTQGLKVVALYPADTTFEEGIEAEDFAEGENKYKAVVIPNTYLVIAEIDADTVKSALQNDGKLTATVTYGDFSKTVDVNVAYPRPTRSTPAKAEEEEQEDNSAKVERFVFEVKESDFVQDGMSEEERAEGLKEYKYARTAMARLVKYMSDNYRTYDNYLYSNLNTQLRNAASDLITATVTISEEQLNAEYERKVNAEYEKYLSTPYAKSTLDDRNTIVHKVFTDDANELTYGYYYVSQVLFKFTQDLSDKIDEFKNEKIASDEAVDEYTRTLAQQIGVWYSNSEYDADAKCEDEDCTCPHCANYKGDRVEYTTLEQW
ncbi:MAG: hypothetical protein J5755_02550, partial [Clostridia bacterium]|nr:hypothetical protein [Clostridia bacterium]